MAKPKKSYLDMFLDNSDSKKKSKYEFRDKEEQAILDYNNLSTPLRQREKLFVNVIKPGFETIVKGVLAMPKFHKLPRSMDREQLIDDTYFRLVEKISKFTPGMIGKNGQPVKAFSYFSTIAKNFILERKVRHEKVLKNKADVEASIDLSILSEDTLKKMSNYDKMDVQLDDYEANFNMTRALIVSAIVELVDQEEAKPISKQDKALIEIGHILMYLLEKWNKIEFMKKNEFMRILTLYTFGLKQQQVSFQFKKFKIAVFKKLKPNGVSKVSSKKAKDIEELFDFPEELPLGDDIDVDVEAEELEDEKVNGRAWYSINTMEEFEISMEREMNDGVKGNMKKRNDG